MMQKFSEFDDNIFETLSLDNEQVNEGKISRALNKFWKWLFGSNKKDNYSYSSSRSSYSFSNMGHYSDIPIPKTAKIEKTTSDNKIGDVGQSSSTVNDIKLDPKNLTKFIPFTRSAHLGVSAMETIKKFVKENPNGFAWLSSQFKENGNHFPGILNDMDIEAGFIFYNTEEENSKKSIPVAIIAFMQGKYADDLYDVLEINKQPQSSYAYIIDMEVVPAARHNHLAKVLLDGACDYLKGKGEKGVIAAAGSDSMVELLKKNGFTVFNEKDKHMSKAFK